MLTIIPFPVLIQKELLEVEEVVAVAVENAHYVPAELVPVPCNVQRDHIIALAATGEGQHAPACTSIMPRGARNGKARLSIAFWPKFHHSGSDDDDLRVLLTYTWSSSSSVAEAEVAGITQATRQSERKITKEWKSKKTFYFYRRRSEQVKV